MLRSNEGVPYLPFIGERKLLAMGLAPLPEGRWIEPDTGLGAYYRNKLRQRESHGPGVYQALPESAAAQRELRDMLLDHLLTGHNGVYRRQGQHLQVPELGLSWPLQDAEALWLASLWVQDDLCLLQESPRGYRLTAASLCAASFWRLEEKLGRTLAAIHQPVPGFSKGLGPQVDRFFGHIKPEYPLWRANWAVVASAELNQRVELQAPVASDTALYLRVERQTLRRLPVSGAVAFTIRVYIQPLGELVGNQPAWGELCRALQGLTARQMRYKSIDKVMPALAALGIEF